MWFMAAGYNTDCALLVEEEDEGYPIGRKFLVRVGDLG